MVTRRKRFHGWLGKSCVNPKNIEGSSSIISRNLTKHYLESRPGDFGVTLTPCWLRFWNIDTLRIHLFLEVGLGNVPLMRGGAYFMVGTCLNKALSTPLGTAKAQGFGWIIGYWMSS